MNKKDIEARILLADELTRQRISKTADADIETKYYLIGKRVAYIEVLTLLRSNGVANDSERDSGLTEEEEKQAEELTYEVIKENG